MSQQTAEAVFQDLRKLSSNERTRFFQLLSSGLQEENSTHEQVFGHLTAMEFTAAQAAEYLEVSMSTFRRYVNAQRIRACRTVGRSAMFSTKDLKTFKRALREVTRS
ncbi:MAG TPA: helix-turn-helix domain-containing protein [Telluria sp.]